MIDERGFIKIIDYGIARILSFNELAYSGMGTPEYMSPEMLNKDGYNFTADWWSVGILMFELRFGKTPFSNRNQAQLIESITNGEIIWPNQARFPRSEEFDDLINKLLQKDRTLRPQTFEEVLAHDWFPKGEELEAIENQSEDLTVPIVPENNGNYNVFDLKTGKNALLETKLEADHIQMIADNQHLFIQFENTQ